MKLLFALASLALSINFDIPPVYQGNTVVTVHTMSHRDINKQCGDDIGGTITLACGDINGHDVYVPNPCTYPEVADKNSYAHLLCHEIAHTEGWRHP